MIFRYTEAPPASLACKMNGNICNQPRIVSNLRSDGRKWPGDHLDPESLQPFKVNLDGKSALSGVSLLS
jgi:hypothetical protein